MNHLLAKIRMKGKGPKYRKIMSVPCLIYPIV